MKLFRLLALLGGLVLAGCQSSDSVSSTPTPTPTDPPHSGRLATAVVTDPITFNPILAVDAASSAAVGPLFDSLVRLDPVSQTVEPLLAERWTSNASGTEVRFFLHRDARWHDGTPVTADDVVFTFHAALGEDVPKSLRQPLTVDGQPLEIEAVGDHVVVVRTPRPFAPLLNSLAIPIVPKHILGEALREGTFARQWGVDTPPAQLIGSGPYRMVEYVPSHFIRLERNPRYWMRDERGSRLPYLEQRIIRIVHDDDDAKAAFRAGEIDLLNLRPQDMEEFRDRGADLGVRVEDLGVDTGMLFLTFNRNPFHKTGKDESAARRRWFTDKRFLRSIAHGIDKTSMIERAMGGLGRPAVSYISPANEIYHDPGLADYPHDPERARQILREAGYLDRDGDGVLEDDLGNAIEFRLHTNAGNPLRDRICTILVEDLGKLGMKVQYRPLDFTLLVEKLDTTFDWDAMLMGFTGSVEPDTAANLLRSSGNLHVWHPNQPSPATPWEAEIDELVDAGSRELDLQERRRIYGRIQAILHEELPMIQTVLELRFVASSTGLENFRPTAWGVYRPERIRVAR